MNFIYVNNLKKTFKVYTRDSGLKNALKFFLKREYNNKCQVNSPLDIANIR